MKEKKKMSPALFWVLVWGLGIAGQLCWNIENQWFNTFVYAKIAKDPTIISWMVAVSSIATTISTFIFGTLSDRRGKRKPFVAWGYILWGCFTILFGTTEFITNGKAGNILLAATAVVFMDALMSFFGSMGNDASFNAWTNDMMTDKNRGGIGAALATQPIIGTIVGTVTGGLLIGSNDNYMRLFTVMGGLVICFGILSLLLMKDSESLKPNKDGTFFHQLISAFNFKEFFRQKELVWVLITLAVYFTAFDVYYPHLGNYLIYFLGFSADSIGLLEGIALIIGMFIVIPASKMVNKDQFGKAAVISVILSCLGVLLLGIFGKPEAVDPSTLLNFNLIIPLVFFGCGYVMFMQVLSVWTKQLFPTESKGQFEGFRIIFFVLLPWLLSPLIANPVIKSTGKVMEAGGEVSYLPTNVLFMISAVLILLTFIPLYYAVKARKKI